MSALREIKKLADHFFGIKKLADEPEHLFTGLGQRHLAVAAGKEQHIMITFKLADMIGKRRCDWLRYAAAREKPTLTGNVIKALS